MLMLASAVATHYLSGNTSASLLVLNCYALNNQELANAGNSA